MPRGLVEFRADPASPMHDAAFDRAKTVASIERIKKIAANLKGTVIIQHDARDVDKLPAFPAFAK